MAEQTDPSERRFRVALETRNLEIGLLWQRSLFFWGFIAAAFVAYGDVMKDKQHDPALPAAIGSFGFVCSVAWTLANRGSKYWQESWEEKLKQSDQQALKTGLFETPYRPRKRRWWGQWSYRRHFSVSRLAMALSDFTVLAWSVLTLRSLPGPSWSWLLYLDDKVAYALPVLALGYAGLMAWHTRTAGSQS